MAASDDVRQHLADLHDLALSLVEAAATAAAPAGPEAFLRPAAAERAGPAAPAAVVPDLPPEIAAWLTRLCLLQGVPFHYLVPDARMLPPESIRWFYVDTNWLDSLAGGALSLGVESRRDQLLAEAMQEAVRRGIAAALMQAAPAATPAGFLLRSALVAAWPRLEVQAFADIAGQERVAALRLDRVAPGLLLGLFADLPRRVELRTPVEALHFGVQVVVKPEGGDGGVRTYRLSPRGLGAAGQQPGAPAGGPSADLVVLRDQNQNGKRVLDVGAMQQAFKKQLGGEVNPAAFALQFVAARQELVFFLG